ncbi:hypothetical protein HYFRA_00005840 [Hymenoscyphus fraxineus]|uniref:Uncharacterized protein n=1 Tax=Hymenoscyphus fraxineus TaxID=746836 RepID=A0A9N9KTZ5_9HELO|nr:hypothetical protein HYFRA_00005840 [Hymenoscyphus fraxineus]
MHASAPTKAITASTWKARACRDIEKNSTNSSAVAGTLLFPTIAPGHATKQKAIGAALHCTAHQRLRENAFVRLSRSSLSAAANHTVTSNDKVMESESVPARLSFSPNPARTLPILSGVDRRPLTADRRRRRLDATQRNAASVLKSNQLLAKDPGRRCHPRRVEMTADEHALASRREGPSPLNQPEDITGTQNYVQSQSISDALQTRTTTAYG